ncbi:MAG: histidine ammonia-lyase [Candidatus Marinimicrobia bacterium]|nr:histidine ammonia-lyase [Candidatus Neomarinimicrobiota bacterium]|tara:strand:- start:1071 stop:2591 length:1521 start_codon:yes stop_codon:yes gene_type:complete
MIFLSGQTINLADLQPLFDGPTKLKVSREVKASIVNSRKVLEKRLSSGETIYGVNTGFGALSQHKIDNNDLERLQLNLVRSHSAGVGPKFDEGITRSILFLKILNFSLGYSGVRWEVPSLIRECLNHDILPVIPSQGSVGASGDLAPLSHLAHSLIGEGRVTFRGRECGASKAMKTCGLQPLKLKAKEGLSLLNGTQVSTALAAEGLLRMENLLKSADLISAISVEATLSSRNVFKPAVHRLKRHRGQIDCATNIWNCLKGSQIVKSHEGCYSVQDPYSFRCIPQVHGACRETWESARRIAENEINSVSDNPLVISDSIGILNSGHFHAEAVGQSSDSLAVAASELGGISERRIYRMMKGKDVSASPFLAGKPGLESGYMMAQITAASLVSENKSLSFPASVDSITTENGQEDFVSMAPIAGRKLLRIIGNLEKVLAIELIVATHLLDLRRPLQPAPITKLLRERIRRSIPFKENDRILTPEINLAVELIRDRLLVSSVNSKIRLR